MLVTCFKMDEAVSRVQKAVTTMISTLDKDSLRLMQAEMYRCSTKCCEDKNGTLDDVQNCIDRCTARVNKAQNYVQGEIQMFQDRLQRCVMSCDDKTRDKMTFSTTEGDMAKLRSDMEKCACKCADEHIQLLPGLTKKMLDNLSTTKY